MGVSPQQIAEIVGEAEAESDFEVWPENWETVQLFLRLGTQWRYGGMGGLIGLDYPSVEALLRMRRVRDKAAMLDALQVMERAALTEINNGG